MQQSDGRAFQRVGTASAKALRWESKASEDGVSCELGREW